MMICEAIIRKNTKNSKKDSLLQTGIIIAIGLAIHNFPEGLAIGSGFGASISLGLSLAISIALHDIPEGIVVATPMVNNGSSKKRALIITVLSGITTGIGAFLGAILGTLSTEIIALSLSFATGCMMYVVSGEIIPESHKLYSGRITSLANILGFIIGLVVTLVK